MQLFSDLSFTKMKEKVWTAWASIKDLFSMFWGYLWKKDNNDGSKKQEKGAEEEGSKAKSDISSEEAVDLFVARFTSGSDYNDVELKNAIEKFETMFKIASSDQQQALLQAFIPNIWHGSGNVKQAAVTILPGVLALLQPPERKRFLEHFEFAFSKNSLAESKIAAMQALAEVFPKITDPQTQEGFINGLMASLCDKSGLGVTIEARNALVEVFRSIIKGTQSEEVFIIGLRKSLSGVSGPRAQEEAKTVLLNVLKTLPSQEQLEYVTRIGDVAGITSESIALQKELLEQISLDNVENKNKLLSP